MQWMYLLATMVFGFVTGSVGLAVGINLNPDSTVRFVPLWGDADAWTVWGTWAGAAGTIMAVALALYYSRHDDKEKLTLISEVHDLQDSMSQIRPQMTLRVVCTGRLPTTIISIGLGTEKDRATFYPIARYTTNYDFRKHLSRGEIFEATLDAQAISLIGGDFSPYIGIDAKNLRFVVKTGLKDYREKLGPEAIAILSDALAKA